jgi:hypothetical protein
MAKATNTNDRIVIGENAVKMVLLKTSVGAEFDVYEAFASYLKENNEKYSISRWWGFKVFGEYDICFIIEKNSFAQDLVYAGSMAGITYSTELLCYLWDKNEAGMPQKDSLDKALNSSLLFVNTLKLKPAYHKYAATDVELEISKLLRNYPNIVCLGTFGWSEFVLLYPCTTFEDGFSHFIQAELPFGMDEQGSSMGLFLKSFTMVGVNYRLLYPRLACGELKREIISKIYPSVSVSCRPSEIHEMQDKLLQAMSEDGQQKKQSASSSLGIYDFVVDIKRLSWGEFIERLIRYRKDYKHSLFKTSVHLIGSDKSPPSKPRVWSYDPFCVVVEDDAIDKLSKLGHPVQESVLATVYTFNQYLQNELAFDCVADMIEYVLFMIRLLDQLEDSYKRQDAQEFIEAMPQNIKYGCNQRLAGFFLQEGEEDFSPFKGGKQRLLKALKCLCMDIFRGVDFDWHGYVVVGRQYVYNHSDEVLSIPSDRAFEVSQYFGLFHEIGHVVDLNNESFWNAQYTSDQEIELLSRDRDTTKEIFCDLFDFQCGFLGDYQLYKGAIPPYLFEVLENKRGSKEKTEEYLLRLLCVTVYSQLIAGNDISEEKADEILREIFDLFASKLPFSADLRKDQQVFFDDVLYSYDSAQSIVRQFQQYYNDRLLKFCTNRKAALGSSRFLKQFEQIMNGIIVHDLAHPQLVVLKMLEKTIQGEKIPFKANVAAIQSFLKTYHHSEWEDQYFPYHHSTRQTQKGSRNFPERK